jgi:hypothetical protein
MWWLIQNIIFSMCLIVMIHYLYIYFETTLTSPKVKDLIHGPRREYKILIDSIHKNTDTSSHLSPTQYPSANVEETLGINTDTKTDRSEDMKSDLKEYIREIASNSKIAIENTNNMS